LKRNIKEWSLNSSPIVLPIAFQTRERNAIYVALFLAEYSGAKVYVTHVLEGEEDHALKEQTLKDIKEVSERFGVRYEYMEIEPDKKPPSVESISRSIVTRAEELDAQAIVMSAHREGLFRELLGRVSDHVARHSKRRVILVESPREGVFIPRMPRKILVPVLKEVHPDPFIIAAALTSSASSPEVEMIAAKVIPLPPTLPLEAVTTLKEIRREEREFSLFTSLAISSLGRLFNPRLLPVRDVGDDVASFAREKGIDLIVMYSSRRTGFYSFLTKEEYEIVSKSPCVVLVTLPDTRQI
jgi:nucleotide-binding universal stress UspA family protein